MVNLRKDVAGENSMKQVPLVIVAYDNSVYKGKDGEVAGQYLDASVHPGDPRAKGQTNLHLHSVKEKDSDRYNNSAAYASSQIDKIKEAAGDNVAPLTNKDGSEVGKIYGVKADLSGTKSGNGLAINTQTLQPSELSVSGDIRKQMIDHTKAAKAAKQAEGATVEAPQAEQQQEAQATADEPALG